MSFATDYMELERRFRDHVDDHRRTYGLLDHQEIFVPMTFLPRVPDAAGEVDTVFIGMYPSQNWLSEKALHMRLAQANTRLASGFRISVSTIWDLVFHLAIRQFLCRDGETYYVTDIAKGAMEPKNEKPNRDWGSWYELLQDEMKLVLDGDQTGMARVIPVGQDVEGFLTNIGFGDWLKANNLGRLTSRATHWAAAPRQNPPWSANSTFFDEYGSKIHRRAAQLLDDVDAAPWWVQHVYANIETSQNPRCEWQCDWLFDRYRRDFAKIKEQEK